MPSCFFYGVENQTVSSFAAWVPFDPSEGAGYTHIAAGLFLVLELGSK